MAKYDYLIVGAGLTSAVFAHEAAKLGKTCLVIDRRDHVAGNVYTKEVEGINVHVYGAHIFHTSLEPVWRYVNQFAEFNNYVNSPVAVYKDELYNMPFNMNTFSKMWGVRTPAEAQAKIEEQKAAEAIDEPRNLEEQALSLVGRDIFEKLVKGYTEKQWGRDCKDLPASIIKRLPVRFIYDNNYFNDRWQGIPMGGYTQMVERMFGNTEIRLGVEYKDLIAAEPDIAERTIYCGPIDEFFDFKLGKCLTRASSSTSTSNSAISPNPSSRASIPPRGNRATSRITPLTTSVTPHSMLNTSSSPSKKATLCSRVVWAAINTTTWTRPSTQRSIWSRQNWALTCAHRVRSYKFVASLRRGRLTDCKEGGCAPFFASTRVLFDGI